MARVPTGFERIAGAPYQLVVRPEAHAWAERAARAGTLRDFAARQRDARVLHGRGSSYSVPAANDQRYIVRHYHRGGAVARALGDRYLRVGATRPERELLASEAARARGIRTPAVAAYAVYSAGIFYRADIVTVEVPRAHDLARELFEDVRTAQQRIDACAAAGSLLREIADKGLLHPDANIKNVLLHDDAHGVTGWILDLDGSRIVEHASPAQKQRMINRFERSLAKWERKTGRMLTSEEQRVLFGTARGERG
jgi:3-deoxy-D-manno-octulosonic acid kinase